MNDDVIKELVGKKWEGKCWDFTIWCVGMFTGSFERFEPTDLVRTEESTIGSVVLMKVGEEWHTGVVWPDGLHFIHACPDDNDVYTVRTGRLTQWPWVRVIEGYYNHG